MKYPSPLIAMNVPIAALWIEPWTLLVWREAAVTLPETCSLGTWSCTRSAKLVSVRLNAVVCEFAMLPEIFCSAKDCACRPVTAVVNASKTPIPILHPRPCRPNVPNRPATAGDPQHRSRKPRARRINPQFQPFTRRSDGRRRGRAAQNCRGSGKNCRGWAFSAEIRLGSGRRVEREFQRDPVDAIAQARGSRPVVEYVAEMSAAAAAMHLGAWHQQDAIRGGANRVRQRRVEARPAGLAVVFRVRGEQRQLAGGAKERALAFLLVERARARDFGAVEPQDLVLRLGQDAPPLAVVLLDFERAGGLDIAAIEPA